MKLLLIFLLMVSPLYVPALQAQAGNSALPQALQGITIEQRLNATVPLDVPFRDEQGTPVKLGDYFHGKPVLLVPVYYTCPMLCNQTLSGVAAGLSPLSLKPGKDFEVVAFSFNPSETPEDAREKRKVIVDQYSRGKNGDGWHFLTGSAGSIQSLTNAIGFHYRYDPKTKMFIHASGVMVLTPEGKLARYFYGVEYEPKDLKLGLIEASHHKIGSPVDEVLLFCCQYDPTTGKYTMAVLNLLRIAGVVTLICMFVGFTILWRRDLRRQRQEQEKTSPV